MASDDKPVDIQAAVRCDLKFALKIKRANLGTADGEQYGIEKSQKNLFFENLSIKELEHNFKSFRPLKRLEQTNKTDTEFHVEKAPVVRTGSTGQEVQVKSGSEVGVEGSLPIALKLLKLSSNISGLLHRKSKDVWVECDEPIPPGAKLCREKGYDTFVCKAEVSLRVPSFKVVFCVKKGWSTKEVKTVPALDVLKELQGWDDSSGTAIVEVEYKVEAEHSVIVDL